MEKLREFVKSTLVGGLLVLLPVAIFVYALLWVFDLIVQAIAPLTKVVMKTSEHSGLVADIVAIGLLIWLCFLVGMFVRTRLGRWGYLALEARLLKRAPGYSMIKETVTQFLDKDKKSPFSSVALARIFGNDTLVSVFITDTHEDGSYTVFMPTGPNPTSGNIYHLPAESVIPIDVPVEDTMRSIISCGAGSSILIAKYNETQGPSAQARPERKKS